MPKVVIINDASVARGGATGLALLQARSLQARGVEVVYVAGDRGEDSQFEALGIEVHNIGGDALLRASPLRAATRGLYSQAARKRVAEVVALHDGPDTVYHVHSFSKALTPAIFGPLQRVASRCFIHAHDFFLACPNGAFMDYQAMQPCHRVPLSRDCLGTNCDKRNYAQKLWRTGRQAVLHQSMPRQAPWGGILMIHPGMAPFLRKAGYPEDTLHSLRNPAEAIGPTRVQAERNDRFVFIGRVEAEKGIEELIAAVGAIGVPLTVIGEGPLRETLTARHPEVTFRGWMDRAGIAGEIASARALVMPTRYPEPFGLVAAEASLSGLPVILSRSALLGPEIDAQGLGFACDTRDPAAFEAILRRMRDLPAEEVAKMSERGASGQAGLCTSPEEWIDRQLALYAGATGHDTSAAPRRAAAL
jgi:glycosyltransferase involved in cell wall biosynthesis